jgi:uncharacterized protein YndB with AHSA1/START domain
MTVKKAASGRRAIELQLDVPGTPEQVWQAIATGHGISSWFTPSEVEEREGGAVVFHLGPDMQSSGKVTAWQPPHRFAYEESDWNGAAPPLATEFIVETRAGGTCTVRLVHSLFAADAAWDDQLDSMEKGWPAYFDVLRIYLAHFPGSRAASISSTQTYLGSAAAAWAELTQALGLSGAAAGELRAAPIDAPVLGGRVERIDHGVGGFSATMRLERPAPGAAMLGVSQCAGEVQIVVGLFFYGDGAAAAAAHEQPSWQTWLAQRFAASGS